MSLRPILLTENTFHAGYLVARWRERFDSPIALRADRPSGQVLAARERFHQEHAGKRELDEAAWAGFQRLYPDAGQADRTMVSLFGVPALPVTHGQDLHYLGRKLNSPQAREWLEKQTAQQPAPFLAVFLDRILAPWWIAEVEGRIVNAHSAILPVARGTFAVEQIAALGDATRFAQSTGATVHYVDEGVDTGPIIEARPLPDPWAYASLWEVKCRCFGTAFDLLMEVAERVERTGEAPASLGPQRGRPEWHELKRRDFDELRQREAERGYLRMRRARED